MGPIDIVLEAWVTLADPRVAKWPTMYSVMPMVYIIAVYLIFVLKLGPKLMENRKPFELKRTIQIYNIFQVVSCLILIYGVATSGWTTEYTLLGCHPRDISDNPLSARLLNFVWWTMALKTIELIETVFFVLRKKNSQISGLHVFHHSITALTAWLGVKYNGGGMLTLSVILNSSVHVLMYAYYFASTLGPNWQRTLRSWKPKLTIVQMVQLTLIMLHTSLAFRDDCPIPNVVPTLYMPSVIVVYFLFYKFFSETYMIKANKKL